MTDPTLVRGALYWFGEKGQGGYPLCLDPAAAARDREHGRVLAERVRELEQSIDLWCLCPDHRPDRWEGEEGVCVLCEAHREHERVLELKAEIERLRGLLAKALPESEWGGDNDQREAQGGECGLERCAKCKRLSCVPCAYCEGAREAEGGDRD